MLVGELEGQSMSMITPEHLLQFSINFNYIYFIFFKR